MKLVPAKCPVCGGTLQIDPTKDAAICEFCNSPFIVEKAINNYNQTIENQTINNNGTINVQNMFVHQSNGYDELSYEQLVKQGDSAFSPLRDYTMAIKYADELIRRFPNKHDGYRIKGKALGYGKIDLNKGIGYLIKAYELASSEEHTLTFNDGSSVQTSEKLTVFQHIKGLLRSYPVLYKEIFDEIGWSLQNHDLLNKFYCTAEISFENSSPVNVIVDGVEFSYLNGRMSLCLLKDSMVEHTICNPWTRHSVSNNLGSIPDDLKFMQIVFTFDSRTKCWRIFKIVNGEKTELFNGGNNSKGGLFGFLFG